MKQKLAIGLAGAAVAALMAGCGGDGDSTAPATTTEAISKQEFIERGDQLCQDFRDASDEPEGEFEQARQQGDPQALADALDKGVELAKDTLEQFMNLPIPAGEEDAVGGYLDVQNRQIAMAEQLSEAVRREDEGDVQTLNAEVERLNAEGDGIAQGIGFQVCGQE